MAEVIYDGKKCPLCDNKEVRKICKEFASDLACTKCGAVYYSLDHFELEKAGVYTGKTIDPKNESLYELASKNRRDDANVGNV